MNGHVLQQQKCVHGDESNNIYIYLECINMVITPCTPSSNRYTTCFAHRMRNNISQYNFKIPILLFTLLLEGVFCLSEMNQIHKDKGLSKSHTSLCCVSYFETRNAKFTTQLFTCHTGSAKYDDDRAISVFVRCKFRPDTCVLKHVQCKSNKRRV